MRNAGYALPATDFKGPVLGPGDAGYDAARRVWNGMFDRRPLFIARCLDAADVSAVVRHAGRHSLPVTVRGGGHNVAGACVADDHVMIDLSLMRHVSVVSEMSVAHADGGCLLRDLDKATSVFRLACPAGVVSHTGLGGLTLGGGYGWLARKWGLTCDHLVGAELVLADGSVVRVTEDENTDLLWGLRGGGGMLGVVTRFTLRLRPVDTVLFAAGRYPLARAEQVLRQYRDLVENGSNDLHLVASLGRSQPGGSPGGAPLRPATLNISGVWLGAAERAGREIFRRFFADTSPDSSEVTVVGYLDLQQRADQSEPHGRRYYTKSCYLTELSGDVARALAESAGRSPSRYSTIDFEYLRGAITEVGPDATAFPHRDQPYICTASAAWVDPALDAGCVTWSRQTLRRLAAWQAPGAYLNYLTPTGRQRLVDSYGSSHFQRLAALKERYDPTNLFGDIRVPAMKSAK